MASKLIKRGSNYTVRYTIPVKYRQLLPRTKTGKLQETRIRSTGLSDLSAANKKAITILAQLKHEVEAELALIDEMDRKSPASMEWLNAVSRDLSDQTQRGLLDTAEAGEIWSLHFDQHLEANGLKPDDLLEPGHLKEIRASSRMASVPNYKPVSFGIADHVVNMNRKGINKDTIKRAENYIAEFQDWAGDPAISDVDRRMAANYMREVLLPLDAAPKTKRWRLSALSSAWRHFHRQAWAETNVWHDFSADLKGSTRGTAETTQRRMWSPEELLKLPLVARTPSAYAISLMMLYHACRVEEIAILRVQDFDLTNATFATIAAKNTSSIRTTPIHSTVLPLLTELAADKQPSDYLFDMTPGTGTTRSSNLSKSMNRGIKKLISTDKNLVWYSLKHTALTYLERAGVEPLMIQRIAGHSTGKVTFDNYSAGPDLEAKREAIEKLSFKLR